MMIQPQEFLFSCHWWPFGSFSHFFHKVISAAFRPKVGVPTNTRTEITSMNKPLCSYAALGGFLRSRDVRSLAQVSTSNQERFVNGDFLLHLRLQTDQLSRLEKDRLPRDEALNRMLGGLSKMATSPLLSLQIFEPRAFRDLFPLILAVLKECSNLQTLDLHDIAIDPIRAAHAAGEFHTAQAMELTRVFNFGPGTEGTGSKSCKRGPGRDLKKLGITAGEWSWEALGILFRCLSQSQVLTSLRLRGRLRDANGANRSQEAATLFPLGLERLKVVSFSWVGSNIYDASYLQHILEALPQAELNFRMESSGGWRGPHIEESKAFERLSFLGRKLFVQKDREYVELKPGVLNHHVTHNLRAMMNFQVSRV